MRQAFAHEALLSMDREADTAAPGAAVTVELCGGCEHPPPCPLTPHHSAIEWTDDGQVSMRVLFAVDTDQESDVRSRIEQALRAGELTGQRGHRTRWRLLSSSPGVVLPTETEHAERLTHT